MMLPLFIIIVLLIWLAFAYGCIIIAGWILSDPKTSCERGDRK